MLRKIAQATIATAFAGSMVLATSPAHAVQTSAALVDARPVTISGAAIGAAECKITGVFTGDLTVALAGEAQVANANVAAVNIKCTARQGTSTVLSTQRTTPGAASATATTGTIPTATTRVCTSGYVVFQSGSIQNFGNANC